MHLRNFQVQTVHQDRAVCLVLVRQIVFNNFSHRHMGSWVVFMHL